MSKRGLKQGRKDAPKRTLRGKSGLPSLLAGDGDEPAAPIPASAEQVASGAREVLTKAHQVDQQAKALHRKVRAARRVALPHGAAAAKPDSAELVIDEKPEGKAKPFLIVGIGASAGGFEAFGEFLQHLPKEPGMAFVLVQHLDPKHKSHLHRLLGQYSKLPVLQATDELEVQPDRIYVIPENSNLTIAEGKLRLWPRKASEIPPMPIDLFFRSLAHEQQSRAIGVVLSGTGSDGTLGLDAIKGEGGITFAQDDQSSKFHGMPGSAIASGTVDFILSPGRIAQELTRIARHPLVGRPTPAGAKALAEASELERLLRESPDEITTLFRLLRSRAGVDFSLYKQSTIKRRIIRRMVLHKKETLGQYLGVLESNPGELDALFHDLLINVTSFFRDPKTYSVLKTKIFPRILKARPDEGPLRLWVCGCATGEEAYSLAMVLVEFLDRNRSHRSAQIFATDISNTGVEKARAGIYPANIQQDVSPDRLRRFFIKVNGNYQVHKSIRDMCVFARQNVLSDPPFSNLDLVSCRNVLIYFGPILQRRIIPLFHYALRSTGFLLLGSSETIGPSAEHFALLDRKHKIYLKKNSNLRTGSEVLPATPKRDAAPSAAAAGRGTKPQDLPEHIDLLLREFSPATVVVNSQMEVVHFRGRTGIFLEHAPGSASLSLFKMLRESLSVSVRAAISRATRQDSLVRHTGIEFRSQGALYDVTVEVVPFRIEPLEERYFAVVFHSTSMPATSASTAEKEPAGRGSARLRRELQKAKTELLATRESMQSIIEEQEGTNEELKSANEEIQSSNEELQSTNEELETAKEELQSTNEELTTLNEELQNRNAELSCAINDLQNLLASVNLAILMVGSDLTIRRFTPVAERLFNLIPTDIGRRLTDMSRSIQFPDLNKMIQQVIEDLRIVEREIKEPGRPLVIKDRDGHWYLLRIRPYRTHENKIEGVVIILIDIDELRQTLGVAMGMVRQPLLLLGVDLKVRSANQSFLHAFGLTSDKTVGHSIYELADKQWDLPQMHTLLEEMLPRHKIVADYAIEAHFPKSGLRKLRLSASRFSEEGKGMPLILLAFEEAGPQGAA